MSSSSPLLARLQGRWRRTLARNSSRRMTLLGLDQPIVSFTFDDFPRSALYHGGRILADHGFAGTFYVSLGLMGQTIATGEMFLQCDLDQLIRQGHELGCHTFDHYDSWDTPAAVFEASMVRNRQAASQLFPDRTLSSFSYPISCPRPRSKRATEKYYLCSREGGQTYNAGTADLNQLRAFFLEQSRDDFETIRQVIDENAQAKGWLIFATHDVCETPSRFGCTPSLFEKVVRHVMHSGSLVLPIGRACRRVLAGA